MKKIRYKRNIDILKINKRIKTLVLIVFLCFSFILIKLVFINVLEKDIYNKKFDLIVNKKVTSNSVPRGRIYDRNYNLLVDNVAVKTIYYKKEDNVTTKEEIYLAYKISRIIDIDYQITEDDLKEFYIIDYPERANKLITKEELKDLENRKLTSNDIYNLKKERITKKDLIIYDEEDKKAIYIYNLMKKGYYYDEKIIKNKNVTDYEYAYIAENKEELKGFDIKEDWQRKYLYEDALKSILGDISNNGIPYEKKEEYLSLGYALNDRVGISGLEYQYESLLKGEKDIYVVNESNLDIYKEGKRGLDIVLTIDINLQLQVERILEEEILKAKKMPNTKYYDHSFVIITEPNTGEILAISGKKIDYKNKNNYKFTDITYATVTETIQPGSIVKGASMIVGYNSGVVKIGSKEVDRCIQIKNSTKKCSWRTLGTVNDLEALKYSSNVFQYKTAIKVGGGKYCYNCKLNLNPQVFDIYRGTFYQFGLGVLTGVDIPNEFGGYKGNHPDTNLIIDYAIGQYDTYTPMQISQYINTIASNGNRIIPHILKKIHSATNDSSIGKVLYEVEPIILNKVNTEEKYIKRVQKGFRSVLTGGTGIGYMNKKYSPAGKTGTSESFIDTNNDGKIDTKTNTKNFIGYAPYDNPQMTIAVSSPNISDPNRSSYLYNVTKEITKKSTKAYFDIFK